MTDHDDRMLAEAFAGYRRVEPNPDEITRVVLAATGARRKSRRRLSIPRLAPAFASLTLIGVFAIPQGRGAIAAGLDEVRSFLEGGTTPGRARDRSEEHLLARIDGTRESTPMVLARVGEEVLAAYRDPTTGGACFVFGRHAATCFEVGSLQPKFLAGQLAPLLVTPASSGNGVVLWGVTGDGVASVELRYANGSTREATVGEGGFIAGLSASETPDEIVARDLTGNVLGRGPVPTELGRRAP
jgi:hypothetical protein